MGQDVEFNFSQLLLTLELVPSSSFFNNVRSHVSKKQWDIVRFRVYTKANNLCEICGGIGSKHPVEAHEIFSYDDQKQIQKLINIIALCPSCHGVKHFGLSQIRGLGESAIKHFMKINKIDRPTANKIISDSFDKWAGRSKRKWTVDISLLKDYGIDVEKIKNGNNISRT